MPLTARIVSIIGWCLVTAIILRVVSGGGTLRGVGYVLGTEPPGVVALMGATLVMAIVAIVAMTRDLPWASAFSVVGAGVALATSLVLDRGGHESAMVGAIASTLVIVIGIVGGRARLSGSRS
jgi:uncharacterized membrane protein